MGCSDDGYLRGSTNRVLLHVIRWGDIFIPRCCSYWICSRILEYLSCVALVESSSSPSNNAVLLGMVHVDGSRVPSETWHLFGEVCIYRYTGVGSPAWVRSACFPESGTVPSLVAPQFTISIASDKDGNVLVFWLWYGWYAGDETRLLFVKSSDYGVTWGTPSFASIPIPLGMEIASNPHGPFSPPLRESPSDDRYQSIGSGFDPCSNVFFICIPLDFVRTPRNQFEMTSQIHCYESSNLGAMWSSSGWLHQDAELYASTGPHQEPMKTFFGNPTSPIVVSPTCTVVASFTSNRPGRPLDLASSIDYGFDSDVFFVRGANYSALFN